MVTGMVLFKQEIGPFSLIKRPQPDFTDILVNKKSRIGRQADVSIVGTKKNAFSVEKNTQLLRQLVAGLAFEREYMEIGIDCSLLPIVDQPVLDPCLQNGRFGKCPLFLTGPAEYGKRKFILNVPVMNGIQGIGLAVVDEIVIARIPGFVLVGIIPVFIINGMRDPLVRIYLFCIGFPGIDPVH